MSGAWLVLLLGLVASPAATEQGWLGVKLSNLTPAQQGFRSRVRVDGVLPETPAASAGLLAGDVLLSFGGEPVLSSKAFVRRVASAQPGHAYTVEVERDGFPLAFRVTLDARPGPAEHLARRFVDKPAPAFKIAHWYVPQGGQRVALEGRVVLVEFWATWCAPCARAKPPLERAVRELGAKGLSVVALSSEKASVLDPYLAKQGLGELVYGRDDRDRTRNAFGVRSYPTFFLIDRAGIVRRVDVGAGDLRGLIAAARALVDKP